jgi:hypothetical protein
MQNVSLNFNGTLLTIPKKLLGCEKNGKYVRCIPDPLSDLLFKAEYIDYLSGGIKTSPFLRSETELNGYAFCSEFYDELNNHTPLPLSCDNEYIDSLLRAIGIDRLIRILDSGVGDSADEDKLLRALNYGTFISQEGHVEKVLTRDFVKCKVKSRILILYNIDLDWFGSLSLMKDTVCSWNEKFKWIKHKFSDFYVIMNRNVGPDPIVFMHSKGLTDYGKAIDKLYKSAGNSKNWVGAVISTIEVTKDCASFLFQVIDQSGFIVEQIRRFKVPEFEATMFFLDDELSEVHSNLKERALDFTLTKPVTTEVNQLYGDAPISKVVNSIFVETFPLNPGRVEEVSSKLFVLNKHLIIFSDN